jgi:exosome complex component RRP40
MATPSIAAKALGVVIPGTDISNFVESYVSLGSTAKSEDGIPAIKLGTGLIQDGNHITSTLAGELFFSTPNKFWIEVHQRRYVPIQNDLVIGVVTARLGEAYRVDLGSWAMATLPFTGFEGTTKKNRPNLQVGDAIFARVSIANKDLEPELVCLDGENRSEGFGELTDGMLYHCSVSYARR